ncbi:helix-turn-helix domain-containing protein [Mangrovivirga cuniculi]|uniref:Transcriptional regulator n=1 Tax=Mangrovivirga cuniculi TaxID=2715131 RepID=A0A4D7JMM3_9BACT|nr:helix-turn-helix domain-containing protein [Mangrovivirga cuniculi]QCK16851.1 transcriptional regulator [Mangrovivirga cuniculi]
MSYIGKNIKKIRVVKKMSQADFAQIFDIARPSVGAYEEGRSEPKIETIIQIAKYFKLSIDTLLTKELTINELYKFDLFKKEFKGSLDKKVDKPHKDSIQKSTPLVTIGDHLNYIVNYDHADFINNLPEIQFPLNKSKKTRAFQISGSEMEYEGCGLNHKDIILCTPIDKNSKLNTDTLYIVVTNDEIISRSLKTITKSTMVFKPYNPAYDNSSIKKEDIIELWKAEAVFSLTLRSPSRLEERVEKLEQQLDKLLKDKI